MTSAATIPGVTFAVAPREAQVSALRTDIAAFAGRTKRGPLGEAVRIEGWRDFERVFGGIWKGPKTPYACTPYAVQGYFENGGQVAYILRLGRPPLVRAEVTWSVGPAAFASVAGFATTQYVIRTSSPGAWGNDLRVEIQYRRAGPRGPAVNFSVTLPGEPVELIADVRPDALSETIEARSAYIRIEPTGAPVPGPAGLPPGPNVSLWQNLRLEGASEPAVGPSAYAAALETVAELPEPAIYALPDLYGDLGNAAEQRAAILSTAHAFVPRMDRLAVIDLPEAVADAAAARAWISSLGSDPHIVRTLAAYHPWIKVNDPLGTLLEPHRTLPPSGHVAGVISRIDRERGAYVTPANTGLDGTVDGASFIVRADQAAMNAMGVNQIRCHSGRGLMVWGGRMLGGSERRPVFVAHRRLLHRLVRAIRRVAQPLVFEANGPELWFSLTRAVTSLLLEAYRAGALQGQRPEEAFRVRCDEELNSPQVRDAGRVICEISMAPAVPMEFITIRVALSADGELEVAEP